MENKNTKALRGLAWKALDALRKFNYVYVHTDGYSKAILNASLDAQDVLEIINEEISFNDVTIVRY